MFNERRKRLHSLSTDTECHKKGKYPAAPAAPSEVIAQGHFRHCRGVFNGLHVTVKEPKDIAILHEICGYGKKFKLKDNEGQRSIMQILRRRQYDGRAVHRQHSSQKSNIVLVVDDSNDETASIHDEVDQEQDSDDSNSRITLGSNVYTNTQQYFKELKAFHVNLEIETDRLQLSLEEAFYLNGLGCLDVVDTHSSIVNTDELWQRFCKIHPCFYEFYAVYHYYRTRCWIVKSGLKFGADFLLYELSPDLCHSMYVVLIKLHETLQESCALKSRFFPTERQIIAAHRLAEGACKKLLIAQLVYEPDTHFNHQSINQCKIQVFLIKVCNNKIQAFNFVP